MADVPMASPLNSRLRSWAWDYLVILCWLGLLLVGLGVPTLAGWIDPGELWTRQPTADLLTAATTVLPVLAYLALTEAGPHHATIGKRRSGLRVTRRRSAGEPSWLQVVTRNAVKLLPWQLGHMAAIRFATSMSTSANVLLFASLLTTAMVIGPPLVSRTGLHDRIAGTMVCRRCKCSPRE